MITTMDQRFVYLKIDGERFKVLRDEWDNATTPTSPIHLIEDDSQVPPENHREVPYGAL
jgi:hypothetical protein